MSTAVSQGAGGVGAVVKKIDDMVAGQEQLSKRLDGLEKSIADASKTQYPHGVPNGVPYVRKGEDPMTSRPFSLTRLAIALAKRNANDLNWGDHAKPELELAEELRKAYAGMGYQASGMLIPLGSDLMPTVPRELADGSTVEGIAPALVKKCRDMMSCSMADFDADEYQHLVRKGLFQVRKDLSSQLGTTGGTLVGLATQGELIEYLRGVEVFSRAGALQIDLPPQGRIRFPRQTSSITIAATSEGATISESTPGTSGLELVAKPYSGLVDIPDELIRFATSVAVEAWLRTEFLRQLSLKTDADQIYGAGGSSIQGVINYSGVRTVVASTVATDGNTLEAADPSRLYADIADQNAPVDMGFFFAGTNTLWSGITTRRADSGYASGDGKGAFLFNTLTTALGDRNAGTLLNGNPFIRSTQLPTNRSKGSGTNLTILLGGVGPEWVIARAGVAEIVMTNSDGNKFTQRLSTMRGTVYMDAGPRHEESFGFIDTLLNA